MTLRHRTNAPRASLAREDSSSSDILQTNNKSNKSRSRNKKSPPVSPSEASSSEVPSLPQENNHVEAKAPEGGGAHKRRKSFFLSTYEAAPHWLKENKFIHGSYRVNFSWRLCLHSMFRIHNETMNVWTHLLGGLFFIGLLVYTLHGLSPHGVDRVVPSISNVESLKVYQENFREMMVNLRDHIPTMNEISESLKGQAKKMQHYVDAGENAISGVQAQFYHYVHRIDDVVGKMQLALTKSCPSCTLQTVKNWQASFLINVKRFSHFVENTKDEFVDHAREHVDSLAKFASLMDDKFLHMVLPDEMIAHDPLTYLPRWPLAMFIVSAICCLMFSATYHLFFVHSQQVYRAFQRLDYMGICLLISGTASAAIYYLHFCNPFRRIVYSTVVALLPLVIFVFIFNEKMMTSQYAGMRATTFVVIGISVAFPLIQFVYDTGYWGLGHWYLVAGGVSYIVGAFFYASKIPERLFPGHFDIWFHSHSIFHILVIIAAFLHYVALRAMYEWRMLHSCEAAH